MEGLGEDMKYTIFTPTYNRKKTLSRLYDSLINQTYKDFEWLIIDDGSRDNTFQLVKKWIREKKIKIRYIYQENQGKQKAWNKALGEAQGEYFIGIDSDDILVRDTNLEEITDELLEIKDNNEVIGLRLLSVRNSDKNIDGGRFPHEGNYFWYDEFYKWKSKGERIDVFKLDIIKTYKFPEINECKFIPELYLYIQISKEYKFKYLNKKFRYFYNDHNNNRLSRSRISKHAKGHYLMRKKMINENINFLKHNPMEFMKAFIIYSMCGFYLNKNILEQNKDLTGISRIINVFFVPLGYLFKFFKL